MEMEFEIVLGERTDPALMVTRKPFGPPDALAPGRVIAVRSEDGHLVAAGLEVQGAATELIAATRHGVRWFRRTGGEFAPMQNPAAREAAEILAIDTSHLRDWPDGFGDYLRARLGSGRDVALRWSGSPAIETLAVLKHGGIFIAPLGEPLDGIGHPIAFITERAGAAATDGVVRLLDIAGDAAALCFGGKRDIEELSHFMHASGSRSAPLFKRRGLLSVEN